MFSGQIETPESPPKTDSVGRRTRLGAPTNHPLQLRVKMSLSKVISYDLSPYKFHSMFGHSREKTSLKNTSK